MMWPSLPLPLPAALFDAAELMEEAERLDGRTDGPRSPELKFRQKDPLK